MRRDVVLLQPTQSRTNLQALLSEDGWAFKQVTDPRDVPTALSSDSCAVGVAVMDEPDCFCIEDLAQAISRSDMEWVAVASREATRDVALARVLATGFFDYHSLPLDPHWLRFSLGHAFGKAMLRRSTTLRVTPGNGRYGMVGTSAPMLDLYRTLDKFVRVDAPVLIGGESGTGKELAAQAIHRESLRRSGPFVPVNCGAIPVTLMQSTLFGVEKGSFTGAHQRRIGCIEAASGGTIFLDEIGDLPLESQASLLRFLQESTIVRIGETRPIKVDARIIAATHLDLAEAIRAGKFREDLFYRLNVLHLEMPPLRARTDDIPLLAEYVFQMFSTQKAPAVRGFAPCAIAALKEYTWPGNVRELINRVQKAMIMCEGSLIGAADLGLTPKRLKGSSMSLASARHLTERDLVASALERNDFNMAATARELGVSRVTLYRLTQRLAIMRRSGPRNGAGPGTAPFGIESGSEGAEAGRAGVARRIIPGE